MASKKSPAAEPATPSVTIAENTAPNKLTTHMVPIDTITVVDKHDRTRDAKFHEGIKELAAGIAQEGLLQPITVKGQAKSASMILVFGERRWLACRLLGWKEIPSVVLPADASVEEIRFAENLQREDIDDDKKALQISERLGAAEEKILAEQGVKDQSKLTPPARDAVRTQAVKRVAERIGWPPDRVRVYAFIGDLPDKTRALAQQGRLSLSHLRVLAQVPDPKRCDQLAQAHAAGRDQDKEPMRPLDDLKHIVHRECSKLSDVLWNLDVAFAGATSCKDCPDNSRNRTGLFDGKANLDDYGRAVKTPEAGVCLKLSCFRNKNAAAKASIRGVGDRIAGKARSAKPAEREATTNGLIRAATEKVAFITPTVFGREVRARVQSKLAATVKRTNSSDAKKLAPGFTKETSEMKAKREASHKHSRAVSEWAEKVWSKVEKAMADKHVERMLLDQVMFTAVAEDVDSDEENPKLRRKSDAALGRALKLVELAIVGGADDIDLIAKEKGGLDRDYCCHYTFFRREPLLMAVCEHLKLQGVPDMPVLEDFLPKPKAEPAAKKPAAKTHAAAKGKAPAKPGKKKAKKSNDPKPLHETAKSGVAVGTLKKLNSKDPMFTPSTAETAAAAREAGEIEDDDGGEN